MKAIKKRLASVLALLIAAASLPSACLPAYAADGLNVSDAWSISSVQDSADIQNAGDIQNADGVQAQAESNEPQYVSIEVLNIESVVKNRGDYSLDGNGNVICRIPKFYYKVTLSDGTYLTGYYRDHFEDDPMLKVEHSQSEKPWTVGGNNTFTVRYGDAETTVAVDLKSSADFEYTEQDGGLFITTCNLIYETVQIPPVIDGKPVRGILSLGRSAMNRIKHLIIPDSVEYIGDNAFLTGYYDYDEVLETVTVGSGVKYLDAAMFRKCENLTAISVSENNPYYSDIDGVVYNKQGDTLAVYPIGKGADYTVPASVADIDVLGNSIYDFLNITVAEGSAHFVTVDGVTYNSDMTKVISCDKNKNGSYDMPDTVTQIASDAFSGCSQLTEVTVADGVTDIVYRAFAGCSSLKAVELPQGLLSIGKMAFEDCTSLESAALPDSLTAVEDKAFYRCSSLSSVTVPGSVKNIGNEAFYYCSGLTGLTIQSGVETIGDRAFGDCSKLTNVTVPGSVKSIGVSAFGGCGSLTDLNVENGVKSIGSYAFYYCSSLTSVTLPNSVTNIGDGVFFGCRNLTDVTLPRGITYISDSMFSGCSSLTSLPIHDGITEIRDRAFSGCTGLTEVTVPDHVTSLGSSVFSGCSNLTDVTLPRGITYISDGMFYSCSSLTSLPIHDGITGIGSGAFSYCTGLTAVTVPDHVTSLGNSVFSGCSNLTDVTLPKGVTYISDRMFYGCSSLTSLPVYDGITGIGSDAFSSCTGLTEITVPDSVTEIAYGAFRGCGNLADIDIPDSVVSIGGHSFDGTAYYNAQPEGPVYIDSVLYKYKGTMPENTELTVKAGTTVIADYAFYSPEYRWNGRDYCISYEENLKKITLPEGLKTVGMAAFFGCSGLTEIDIPASVSRIDFGAFANCTSLSAINVAPDNPYYKSEDGVLYSKDGAELIWCPLRSERSYEVPYGVKLIKKGAFGCSGVYTLTVTDPRTVLEPYSVGYNLIQCIEKNKPYGYWEGNIYGNDDYIRWDMNILCAEGSAAYEYAEENGFTVTVIDAPPVIPPDTDPVTPPDTEPDKSDFDVNGDGKLNSKDLTRLMKFIAGEKVEIAGNADINGDSKVNSKDLTRLMKYIAGAI